MSPKDIGVIVTTYNQPGWLSKSLTGFECQEFRKFRIIIADDGSGDKTRDVIEHYQRRGLLSIDHVWHPDDGFQKCAILNKAIKETDCDYLIFTDGDCIPRSDFVAVHVENARRGWFLSSGYIKLTMRVSELITLDGIRSGEIFDRTWLIEHGQPRSRKLWRLSRSRRFQRLMNILTPTRPTWNGSNSSTWREHLIAVNGFNEDMGHGDDDTELGDRLWNYGIKSKQIRFSTVSLHLEHERGYAKPEIRAKNMAIRQRVKRTGAYWVENGITKAGDEDTSNQSGAASPKSGSESRPSAVRS